jgi:hypothetical protein
MLGVGLVNSEEARIVAVLGHGIVVVNNLVGFQLSAKDLFHYQTMLSDIAPGIRLRVFRAVD